MVHSAGFIAVSPIRQRTLLIARPGSRLTTHASRFARFLIPDSLFLISFFLLLPLFAAAQNSKTEITKTDITTIKNFSGDKISVFGLYLGMSKAAAKKVLDARTDIYYDPHFFNFPGATTNKTELTAYICDTAFNSRGQRESFATIRWDKDSTGLTQIVIFKYLLPHVKGKTSLLFTPELVNENSPLIKKLLGKPDKVNNDGSMRSCFFKAKKFVTIKYVKYEGTDHYFALTTRPF